MKCGRKLIILTNLSCIDCKYMKKEYYVRQNDNGYEVSCLHPKGKGYIGELTANTPVWCPFILSE